MEGAEGRGERAAEVSVRGDDGQCGGKAAGGVGGEGEGGGDLVCGDCGGEEGGWERAVGGDWVGRQGWLRATAQWLCYCALLGGCGLMYWKCRGIFLFVLLIMLLFYHLLFEQDCIR